MRLRQPRAAAAQACHPGINHPYLYVGGTVDPSPFQLRVEDSLIYPLHYLHAGASEFWVIVPASERDRLECLLLEHFTRARARRAASSWRHMSA